MLKTLIIGFGTMSLCLLLQTTLLVQAMRYYVRHDTPATNASTWSTWVVINCVMILLVLGNLAQLTIWAVVFWLLGEFDSLVAAVYHSAVNFATLGYGDLVMSERNRFLGPLEAINGILMVGVSTAVLMATFQNAIKKRIEVRVSRELAPRIPDQVLRIEADADSARSHTDLMVNREASMQLWAVNTSP